MTQPVAGNDNPDACCAEDILIVSSLSHLTECGLPLVPRHLWTFQPSFFQISLGGLTPVDQKPQVAPQATYPHPWYKILGLKYPSHPHPFQISPDSKAEQLPQVFIMLVK